MKLRLITALGLLPERFHARAGGASAFRPSLPLLILLEVMGFACIAVAVGWEWGVPAGLITAGVGAIITANILGGNDANHP